MVSAVVWRAMILTLLCVILGAALTAGTADRQIEPPPHKFKFVLRHGQPLDLRVFSQVQAIFQTAGKGFLFEHSECGPDDMYCGFAVHHFAPVSVNRECLVSPPSFDSDDEDRGYERPHVLHSYDINSWGTGNQTAIVEEVLEYGNLRTQSFVSLDGSLSALGTYIDNLADNMFRVPHTESNRIKRECSRIRYSDWRSNMSLFADFLLRQEPVIIEGVPVIHPSALAETLRPLHEHRVSVKLSPDREFEGIDSLVNWGMAGSQYVPREILDQMQSPDLVVVRAAHTDMRLKDLFKLFTASSITPDSDKDPVGSVINAYVEYLPIRNDLSNPLRQLLDKLLPQQADQTVFPTSKLSFVLPAYLDSILQRGKAHIWLGDGRAIGKLHFDPFDNLLFQIEGSKTFLLADPASNERFSEGHMREAEIDVVPLRGQHVNADENDRTVWNLDGADVNHIRGIFRKHVLSESTSMVHSPIASLRAALESIKGVPQHEAPGNSYDPNTWEHVKARFPLARGIPRSILECEVSAGSAIFVPSFWWHEVESHPGEKQHFVEEDDGLRGGGMQNPDGVEVIKHNFSLNAAVNFWFDPVFSKEFPCATCRKYLSPDYRKFVATRLSTT
jgi:jumonji domain-containing protein 7